MTRRPFLLAAALLGPPVVFLGSSTPLHAADPALAGPITLDQAVRVTVSRSPVIRRSLADIDIRAGAVRENRGAFASFFTANPTFDYQYHELLPNSVISENRTRLLLTNFASSSRQTERDINAALGRQGTTCPPEIQGKPIEGTDQTFTDCDATNLLNQVDISDTINLLRGVQLFDLVEDMRQTSATLVAQQLGLAREIGVRAGLQLIRRGVFPTDETARSFSVDASVSKPFRNGLMANFGLRFTGSEDNYYGYTRDPVFGGKGPPNHFLSAAGLSFNVPLGRGRGRTAVAASERAAIASYEAERGTSHFTTAQQVLRTTQAYLNLAAAQETHALLSRSLAAQREILQATEEVVKAGESPSSELDRTRARVADVEGSLASAEINIVNARAQLAQAMGVTIADSEVGPSAAQAVGAAETAAADPRALTRRAVQIRQDLEAARLTTEAARHLAAGARSDLKRQFDLTLSGAMVTGYDAPNLRLLPDERCPPERCIPEPGDPEFNTDTNVRFYNPAGYFRAIQARWLPSLSIGISFDLPIRNSVARGRLAQAQANEGRAAIRMADLRRTIEDNVAQFAASAAHAQQEVARRERAVKESEATWEAQLQIRKQGESTLIDTLTTEDQLTSARTQLVQARLAYAQAVARLRFESGTLVEFTGGRPDQPPTFRSNDLVR